MAGDARRSDDERAVCAEEQRTVLHAAQFCVVARHNDVRDLQRRQCAQQSAENEHEHAEARRKKRIEFHLQQFAQISHSLISPHVSCVWRLLCALLPLLFWAACVCCVCVLCVSACWLLLPAFGSNGELCSQHKALET